MPTDQTDQPIIIPGADAAAPAPQLPAVPLPITREQVYRQGSRFITEIIVVSGEAPPNFPRFITSVRIQNGGDVVQTPPIPIDAQSIEEAFEKLPALLEEVAKAGKAAILNNRIMNNTAAAAAGIVGARGHAPTRRRH